MFALYAKKEDEYFCLILFYEEHKHNTVSQYILHVSLFL
jgi:hypothetical protein